MSLSPTPSEFHAELIADIARSRALQVRLDELQDALDEARYPPVPFDSAAWSDPTRYAADPDDVTELERAMGRDWPGQS